MSHNYPYRRPTSDIDLRPEAGHYSSADRRHSSSDHEFYRPPESYPSSSSSRGSTSAQWAQDGALSILSSCGLEPSDLALLAELPEDVLTVESLPSVLKQIKGKRGTINSFRPSTLSPSPSSSSYRRPPVSSSGDWDRLRSQPIQYPLDHVAPSSLPSEQDRWRNPRTSASVRSDPLSASSSSSRYIVDFHHRIGPSEYGKAGRNAGPVSSQDHHSFSSAGQGTRSRPTGHSETRSADYRSAPRPELYHPKPRGGHREPQTSSTRKSTWNTAATLMPSEKEALDFHGTCPTVFPYSCSLCDITVLSEKVWIKHINGTQHAEGQLSLLQKFPEWDCRVESVSRAKKQVEKGKDEEKTTPPSQTSSQNHKSKPNAKTDKKIPEKSKVVCVKFPPQSVDEAYLRKLTEPFGKIVKILMFPSLAFVELGSTDQAKDLVKFHVNYPPTVNGEQIEFSISNTFNFLRSSQVVSFTPVPSGEDGQSDLISIIKRFGPPLYSMFLPSMAYVEMKNVADAQKLVDYYSSNTLRINNYCIKVSFSGEYKTLMQVPSAQKYEEETVSTKRTRSSSQEKEDDKMESKRTRSSKDREHERRKSGRERRSRSREKSSREKRTRSRSRDKLSNETTTETSSSSASRDKSREKSSRERKSRSRSRDNSSSRSPRQDRSREKLVEGEKPEPESKEEPAPRGEAAETQQPEDKAELSADDSDIEGMEVIGEDGENVEVEDMEIQNSAEEEEEEEEEEAAEENEHQTVRTDSPEHDKEVEVRAENDEEEEVGHKMKKPETKESETNMETEEAAETQLQDDEEEADFPIDLENCITLDELEEDQSDSQDEDVTNEAEFLSTRVVSFQDLPLSSYTDAEFIKLVQDFGKAVRYLLIRENQEGFIEMSSSSEAQRAAEELSCKSVTFNSSKLIVSVSHQYHSLSNWCEVQSDSDQENKTESQTSSRTKQQNESKTSDRDEESSKKSPEEESEFKSAEKVPETESNKKYEEKDMRVKESDACKKSPDEESSDSKTEMIHRRTPDKELSRKNTSEELEAGKTEENNSATDESPGKEPSHETCREKEKFRTTSENDSDLENESNGEKIQTENEEKKSAEETPETEECEGRPSEDQRVCSEEEETLEPARTSPDPPESTGNSPKPQTEQLQDSEEQAPGPAGGAAKPEEPTKPVGTEFVRPVVGYFCNLCQLIYADEDEAKLQHCSSLMHYSKYQEKTGKDPWSS